MIMIFVPWLMSNLLVVIVEVTNKFVTNIKFVVCPYLHLEITCIDFMTTFEWLIFHPSKQMHCFISLGTMIPLGIDLEEHE